MSRSDDFRQHLKEGYTFKGESFVLGAGMLEGKVLREAFIRLPLKTLNRHGLIAGATGTGKTKTLQLIAEQLSSYGVPSLVMDVKGDLSGIAMEGETKPFILERHEKIGWPFIPGNSPVEFLSLSEEKGVKLRATVSEFGPVLFSKILELNETQSGVIGVIFKYSDDQDFPLVDLEDFKKVMRYISDEGKPEFEGLYGKISSTSTGTILRKIVELEQQGVDIFFGEPSFDMPDLARVNENGKGIISVLRLVDIQDKPKLFSSFMLQMLAEIYSVFPEVGDVEKPKLVLFIDEAHLIFNESSKVLLNQIEIIIKLIRSKGIGVIFITQNPADIPEAVLSQLGLKIQHALRAFTAKDRKAINLASENYPDSKFYNTSQLLTELGIGEAMVTALNEKGIPTPLAHTYLRAPQSRMDILDATEIDDKVRQSVLVRKYEKRLDIQSAREILSAKIEDARNIEREVEYKIPVPTPKPIKKVKGPSTFEKVVKSPVARQIGNTIARELTRGILGVLGVRSTNRTRKSGGFGKFW